MSVKISQISYFSFTFRLNEKKKLPLKKFSLERGGGGVTEKLLEGGLIFNRELGTFKRRGRLHKKWMEKN